MTGVDIEQWRGHIGTFHRKKFIKISNTSSNNFDSFSVDFIYPFLRLLSKPLKLCFSLMLLFSYCSMVLIVFPILFMIRLIIIFIFINNSCIYPNQSWYNYLQPVQIFLGIQMLPSIILFKVTSLLSFFRNLSKNVKNIMFYIFILQLLLFISGTIELNPGPILTKKSMMSFAVWNLDSLPARNYARIPLIESFQASYDFDIFGICESSLNNDIKNENIFIEGFCADPFSADKPVGIRNGGVCLYYKEDLPIIERCDLETLPETIVAEVKLNKDKIFFVLSYCHPALSKE